MAAAVAVAAAAMAKNRCQVKNPWPVTLIIRRTEMVRTAAAVVAYLCPPKAEVPVPTASTSL